MTTIKLKNGSGAPLAGDLVQGEPALDLTNKRLYTENSSGTVIEVGTNPTSLTTGTVSADSIGVGIDSPDTLMHLRSTSGAVLRLARQDGSVLANDTLGKIEFYTNDVTNTGVAGYIETQAEGGAAGGALILGTGTAGSSAERMRISAAGNVGIGTSSPNTPLQVSGANSSTNADAVFSVQKTTEGYGLFSGVLPTGVSWLQGGTSDDAAYYNVALQPNGGNVGIGDDNPLSILHIGGGSDANIPVTFAPSTGGNAEFRNTSSTGTFTFTNNNGSSEAMRIDGSGNLLVGKTSADGGTNGGEIRSNGETYLTTTSAQPLALNRKSTDGTIVNFSKDGTTVGSIGAVASQLYIAGGDTGLQLNGTSDQIRPCDGSGAARDAAIDLGDATRRFKDLYLSGTARANQVRVGSSLSAASPDYTFQSDSSMGMFRLPGVLGFSTVGTERMRIDSSGNLLVGKTSSAVGSAGAELQSGAGANAAIIGTASVQPLILNRLSTDGDIAQFRKDGTTVGSIGTNSNGYTYYCSNSGITVLGQPAYTNFEVVDSNASAAPRIRPSVDNLCDLGDSGRRFDDVWATNGTIQTSDRNEKQDVETLSDAEQRVAVAAKGLLRKFRWIDSVEEKGDDARIHFGIIAQDLQDAFTAEGLDAGRYAMFISSTWWESTEVIPAVEAQEAVVDEEGNVVEEAVEAQEERTVVHTHDTAEEAPEGSVERTRLGVRYPELLAFIIAAI